MSHALGEALFHTTHARCATSNADTFVNLTTALESQEFGKAHWLSQQKSASLGQLLTCVNLL